MILVPRDIHEERRIRYTTQVRAVVIEKPPRMTGFAWKIRLGQLGVESGMSFDQGIFAIVRSLMYLDGMVLRCNPDAVLMEDMKAFIDDFEKFI